MFICSGHQPDSSAAAAAGSRFAATIFAASRRCSPAELRHAGGRCKRVVVTSFDWRDRYANAATTLIAIGTSSVKCLLLSRDANPRFVRSAPTLQLFPGLSLPRPASVFTSILDRTIAQLPDCCRRAIVAF